MEASALTPISQVGTQATYAPRLRKADGAIDWDTPAGELDRFIRGVSPWPSAQTSFRGKRARILHASPVRCESADAAPGVVCQVCQNRLVVAAGGGTAMLIEMIQPEGRRAMDARSFMAGYRPVSGDRFGT
jgi:methionyl-tRNA formyltransferase